jgi:type IV pilus assembly protein PilY1
VKGEWSSATLTCVNVSGCGANLGNTYGVPQIRRFHNGKWGAVFGNGLNTQTARRHLRDDCRPDKPA